MSPVMRTRASMPAQRSFRAAIGDSVKTSRFEDEGVATSTSEVIRFVLRPRSAAGFGGGGGSHWGGGTSVEMSLEEALGIKETPSWVRVKVVMLRQARRLVF